MAATLWKQPTFTGDDDGKMSAKFKRLMGMKDDSETAPATAASSTAKASSTSSSSSAGSSFTGKETDVLKKQQKYFADLEKQYEVARMTTHTQRGLGLGFGSSTSLR